MKGVLVRTGETRWCDLPVICLITGKVKVLGDVGLVLF